VTSSTDASHNVWYVYMVKCADDTLYTGIATDVLRRLQEHNESARGARYTRARRPVTLVYQEEVANRSEALKREHQVRKMNRQAKQELLIRHPYQE